jgi:hypothetical protein
MAARQRIHSIWLQAVSQQPLQLPREYLRNSQRDCLHFLTSGGIAPVLPHVLPLKKEASGTSTTGPLFLRNLLYHHRHKPFYSRQLVKLFGTEVIAMLLSVTILIISELSCLSGEHQFQVYTMASSATLGHKGFAGY